MRTLLAVAFLLSAVLLSAADERYTKVALLGSSESGEDADTGIHKDVLTRLLILVKERKPEALFFLGDLTVGAVKGGNGSPIPDVEDSYGTNWSDEGYTYNSPDYQQQLDAFSAIVKSALGSDIPVYPVAGFHESMGRDSAALLKRQFGVRSQVDPASSPLAYTVGIKNAFFVVFSTSSYDPVKETIVQHDLNAGLLAWIEAALRANRQKYDYFFAVSYEPAFSTEAAEGKYHGLDADQEKRDELWRILSENGVMAYFASSEHLYDRTNRAGIWQVITGGAGAPLHKRAFDKAFYHFLLLSIPTKKGKLPRVQVYDAQGSLDDAFDLIPKQYPVYQLRISQSAPEVPEAERKP